MSSRSIRLLSTFLPKRILPLHLCLTLAALSLLFEPTSLFAQSQPTVLWTYDFGTGGIIITSPALAPDGTIYLGGAAITNNGSQAGVKWSIPNGPLHDWGAEALDSVSLATDGTIYFGSGDGNLYAINPDGSKKWAFYTGGGGGTPAIALDGTIYYNGYTYLFAISSAGNLKWKALVGEGLHWSSPAIGPDGTITVSSFDARTLNAFHPDGSLKWQIGLVPVEAESSAIGSDGTIYVTGNPSFLVAGNLIAINSNGTQLWMFPLNTSSLPDYGPASPAIGVDGAVYCASWRTGCLSAFEPNGNQRWSVLSYDFGTNMAPTTPAVDSAGNLYYSASNSIIALSSDGNVKWSIYDNSAPEVQGTSPVIGPDGTIYASLGSKLYAIAGTNALANSSWPMAGHDPRHTGSAERPYFKNPRTQPDGTFALSFYGHLGRNYSVQTSTDLTNWTPLTNLPVTNIPMDVLDPPQPIRPLAFIAPSRCNTTRRVTTLARPSIRHL
jgi:outer membrane protein assembly factor BamB